MIEMLPKILYVHVHTDICGDLSKFVDDGKVDAQSIYAEGLWNLIASMVREISSLLPRDVACRHVMQQLVRYHSKVISIDRS